MSTVDKWEQLESRSKVKSATGIKRILRMNEDDTEIILVQKNY